MKRIIILLMSLSIIGLTYSTGYGCFKFGRGKSVKKVITAGQTAGKIPLVSNDQAKNDPSINPNVNPPTPQKVGAVTLTPGTSNFATTMQVIMTCATSGTIIRFTMDGTNPTSASTAYTAPITLTTATVVKAIGMKSGWTDGDVATGNYTFVGVTPIGPLEITDVVIGNIVDTGKYLYVDCSWKTNKPATTLAGADYNDPNMPFNVYALGYNTTPVTQHHMRINFLYPGTTAYIGCKSEVLERAADGFDYIGETAQSSVQERLSCWDGFSQRFGALYMVQSGANCYMRMLFRTNGGYPTNIGMLIDGDAIGWSGVPQQSGKDMFYRTDLRSLPSSAFDWGVVGWVDFTKTARPTKLPTGTYEGMDAGTP